MEKNQTVGKEGKLYRALSTTAFIGIFLAAGVVVTTLVNPSMHLNAWVWGVIVSIGVLSLGIISVLPWIRRLEKGEYKKISLTFIIFVAVCVDLWLVCIWLAITMFSTKNSDGAIWLLWFIKITVIISLQLMVATVVGDLVTKVKKTMIPFQVITYASYAFADFYLSFLLVCITITPAQGKIGVSSALGVLGNPLMVTLFCIALVYMMISSFIVKSIETRRMRNMATDNFENMISGKGADQQAAPAEKTMEGELTSLKDMLDKGLITEEEYANAKKNIIEKYTK